MRLPLLRMMKGRGQREDRLPVLDPGYPAGGEGPAIADPFHQVNKRDSGVAWPDEIGMQRVHGPVRRDGAAGRDQRLPGHLAAEHPLPALVLRAAAAEDVDLDLLQVEEGHHTVQCLAHDPAPPVSAGSAHSASTAAPYRSSLAGPTPGTTASSVMLAGRRSAMTASVASEKMT